MHCRIKRKYVQLNPGVTLRVEGKMVKKKEQISGVY